MSSDQIRHPDSVAIVGGGLAGFTTARELRARGYEGDLVIIDPEGVPYDRPPLSKAYLNAEPGTDAAAVLDLAPENWFDDHHVDITTASATALDPQTGTVTLDTGDTVRADIVVLAMGGHARVLPIPGGDLPGLAYLRTRADADRLRTELVPGRRISIIGAGLIGAEITSVVVARGCHVTLIDPMPVPGLGPVGEEIAVRLHQMHADHGVDLHCAMTEVISHDASSGTWTVTLNDDTTVDSDLVLVAVGIAPHTSLAEAAGLEVDGGVVVDPSQRTAHPGVYAIGDICRVREADGTLGVRHEHWDNAIQQGQTAAAAILGQDLPSRSVGWMWSDRYDVHVEAVGNMLQGHRIVREVDGEPVAAFRMADDGTMIGAAAIDGGMTIRAARRIIDRGIIVDPDQLADPQVNLKKFAR